MYKHAHMSIGRLGANRQSPAWTHDQRNPNALLRHQSRYNDARPSVPIEVLSSLAVELITGLKKLQDRRYRRHQKTVECGGGRGRGLTPYISHRYRNCILVLMLASPVYIHEYVYICIYILYVNIYMCPVLSSTFTLDMCCLLVRGHSSQNSI